MAIPETTADNKKIMGINGVDHQGFDFTAPKINPAYPCRTQADGIPTAARNPVIFLSNASDSSETSVTPNARTV